MGDNRLESLTEMQPRVLRLYHRRLSAKEMAVELGISENTIKTHLTQAAARLGVGREQAARLLAASEGPHPIGASPSGAMAPPPPAPPAVEPAAQQVEPAFSWRALLPLRLGAEQNDLSVAARLLWIPVLAAVLAIGFGAVFDVVHGLSDLVRAHRR